MSEALSKPQEAFASHANASTKKYGRNLAFQRYPVGRKVRHVASQVGITRVAADQPAAKRRCELNCSLACLAQVSRRSSSARNRAQVGGLNDRSSTAPLADAAHSRPQAHHQQQDVTVRRLLTRGHTAAGGRPPITRLAA